MDLGCKQAAWRQRVHFPWDPLQGVCERRENSNFSVKNRRASFGILEWNSLSVGVGLLLGSSGRQACVNQNNERQRGWLRRHCNPTVSCPLRSLRQEACCWVIHYRLEFHSSTSCNMERIHESQQRQQDLPQISKGGHAATLNVHGTCTATHLHRAPVCSVPPLALSATHQALPVLWVRVVP